jgi:DNA-binding GntR family transcriptional regulator
LTYCPTTYDPSHMLTELKQVKLETLRSQVENTLRQAIIKGKLRAGEKLIERELCEMLGVSRQSLREAIRKLEAEKLITSIPHRGPEVASITMHEARELYALRQLLESYAAQEFTLHASDQQIKDLVKAVKRLKDASKKHNSEGVLEAKAEFYGILLGGCGNHLVSEILGGLLSRVSLLRATSLMLEDRLPQSLREMEALVQCIQARDAAGAKAISVEHVSNAQKAALGVLEVQYGVR